MFPLYSRPSSLLIRWGHARKLRVPGLITFYNIQSGNSESILNSRTHTGKLSSRRKAQSLPSFGKIMRYSVLHCGHRTLAVLLPRCFSSTHRCKHIWWTQRFVPRHRHGLTHSASRSSSSDAKQTQHVLCQYTYHSLNQSDLKCINQLYH